MCPYCRASARSANSDSARSRAVSPMPIRIPVVNGIATHGRLLVRGAVVRGAGRPVQPLGRGLQHHPHARRDRLEPRHLFPRHHAGIEVREQAGLFDHEDGHRAHVIERGGVAARGQPGARLGPAGLGSVPEREQRFFAPGGGAGARDVEHLLGRQERRLQPIRRRRERAVPAAVAAQARQGDEDLSAVRHRAPDACVAHPARDRHEVLEIVVACGEQRFRFIQGKSLAFVGATQRAPNGVCDVHHRYNRRGMSRRA